MRNLEQPGRRSMAAFVILGTVIAAARLTLPRWFNHDVLAILSWDVFGYYLYLPAQFIHHDLGIRDFGWVQGILDTYHPTVGFYQAYPGPAGDFVMKYPMGLAILYSPFFFAAHLVAQGGGFPADGFSMPYQLAQVLGGLFYTLTGIWFLRKILLRYLTDGAAAFTMAVVVLATNYFELTAFDGTMPHNYLFTLYALIVWLTIRWHERPGLRFAIPLGLLAGLTVLVRPTAGLIVLVPVLWNTGTLAGLKEKLLQVRRHLPQVIVMAAGFVLVVSFQLIYWKLHSGRWIYYSYEKNEQLEWIAPYLWKVLFSYKKGWLVYTPVMILALAGFFPLAARCRKIFPAVFLFFAATLLTVASWPTWWYGGSLGQRAMMESYLLLALPLGALLQWVLSRKPAVHIPFFLTLILVAALNLFQTWQYIHFIIDPERMTGKYYWSVFGKTSVGDAEKMYLEPLNDNDALDVLPDEALFTRRTLALHGFETPDAANPGNFVKDTANTGNWALRMSKQLEFSPGLGIPFGDLKTRDFSWIRATGFVFFTCKPEEVQASLVITCMHGGKALKYRAIQLEKANLEPGRWHRISMDYQLPWIGDKADLVQVYFWYHGSGQMLVDDLEITLFEPKN